MGRLQEAATVYRDRWLEYTRETAGQPPYWARRGYGLSIGQKYLVRFLLLAGQIKKAAEVTDVLVSSLLEEVQDQPSSEEHTSELQSLMRSSYAVFCLKKNKPKH